MNIRSATESADSVRRRISPVRSAMQWLAALDFRKAIWLAPLVWTLHEAEEWDIAAFERAHFVDPGYMQLEDHAVLWIGLAWVALQGIVWTGLTAWPRNPRFAAYLTLPWFIVISFGNVLGHIWWESRLGGYAPGILTALLLVGPIVVWLTVRAIRERLIPWWYAVAFYLLALPGLVATIQAGNELPHWLQSLQQNGIHLARVILGRE